MGGFAIEVTNVTKSFKVYQEGGQSAKERLIRAGLADRRASGS